MVLRLCRCVDVCKKEALILFRLTVNNQRCFKKCKRGEEKGRQMWKVEGEVFQPQPRGKTRLERQEKGNEMERERKDENYKRRVQAGVCVCAAFLFFFFGKYRNKR